MKKFRILVDMDEVLTDFVGGYARDMGFPPEQLHNRTEWSMNARLGQLLGRDKPISSNEFWHRLQGRAVFWMNLNPLPWAGSLMNAITKFTKDWQIVSSPSYCEGCYRGKVYWLKNYFGPEFNRFCLTPYKELFANPFTILIDDREENINKFIEHGGHGILFPEHTNKNKQHLTDPVSFVTQQLEELKCRI